MADITIPFGQAGGSFSFTGQDSGGVVRSISGTITVSNYAQVYVASRGVGANPQFAVVPKGTPPAGTDWSVAVTINATATDGSTLSKTLSVDIQGPPAPPPATTIVVQVGSSLGSVPADPGSGTISFSM